MQKEFKVVEIALVKVRKFSSAKRLHSIRCIMHLEGQRTREPWHTFPFKSKEYEAETPIDLFSL